MPFVKGQSGNANGRGKGVPNKVTKDRRDFLKNLLDGEEENIKDALHRTRIKSPHLYLNIIADMMEFDTPKLSRVEMQHEGEINTTVVIEGVQPPDELQD